MAPVVLSVAVGLFGTTAVPAAFATTQDNSSAQSSADAASTGKQTLAVSEAAALTDTSRDGYTSSSKTVVASTSNASVSAARAATAANYQTSTSSTADTSSTASTSTSTSTSASTSSTATTASGATHAAVVAYAEQFIGTPYVYGGASPSGFDCSGYIMYVYAHFGISLAHSVPLQDSAGTTVSTAEAQPGDVVIFNNGEHDGFYMGNGMIMDAPKPGGSVSIRKIWTTDYHIVRFINN